jgi:V/A-type H+-transporting ATPase subunit G/H
MSIAILKDIAGAEEKAELMEAQAQQKAKEIVAAARTEAAALLDNAMEEAEREAREIVKASEKEASLDIEQMRSHTRSQCDSIRENSGRRLQEAVDFIIGRIIDSDR